MLISLRLQGVPEDKRIHVEISKKSYTILNHGQMQEPIEQHSYHDGLYYCNKVLDKEFSKTIPFHNFLLHILHYKLNKTGSVNEHPPRFINDAYEFVLTDKENNLISLLRNGWILQSFATRCRAINGIIAGYKSDWDFTNVYPIITDEGCNIQIHPKIDLEHWSLNGFEKSFHFYEIISDNYLSEIKKD